MFKRCLDVGDNRVGQTVPVGVCAFLFGLLNYSLQYEPGILENLVSLEVKLVFEEPLRACKVCLVHQILRHALEAFDHSRDNEIRKDCVAA